MTWTKSQMMVIVAPRAAAWAWMRAIWWWSPSTSTIQVRWRAGSRRCASAKMAAVAAGALSSAMETVSHLAAAWGPGRRW